MARYIDIINEAGRELLNVLSPARYTGGEAGRLAKRDTVLQTIIAFPDLYEIGMSNNAVRILYNVLNGIDDVSCGRAFAPAPDFEKILKQKNILLYDLDTGLALKDCDVLMFSLSYELCATSLLAMLNCAGIPLDARERTAEDPLVIAGGPCAGNPLPYSDFIDAFWIGEAEGGFFELVKNLRDKKKAGAARSELLDIVRDHPFVWAKGKSGAVRAIDKDFSRRGARAYIYPIPSLKIVQAHSSVEIMRGCPNGCRFCFAGIWYRPARRKAPDVIKAEVESYIREGGAREISLSSLSSGDYAGIDALVDELNTRYSGQHVSFQLPSLHVSTLSLALLEKTNKVRKGGLTFAVETPLDMMQLSVNKEVTLESVVLLLREAKRSGYRTAKFYFMIGLPTPDAQDNAGASGAGGAAAISEEDSIIDFINEAAAKSNMRFSINVGLFIPKPHTPFQWAAQLDYRSAQGKLFKILNVLKRKGHKVSVHNAFNSFLEGILARADGRVCAMIRDAFNSGCRLDAWSEFFKEDVWHSIIDKYKDIVGDIVSKKAPDAALPWDMIQSGTTKEYLKNELDKSNNCVLTTICKTRCGHHCGVCNKAEGVFVENDAMVDGAPAAPSAAPIATDAVLPAPEIAPPAPLAAATDTYRIIFSYTKAGPAAFLSHLSMIEVFSTALLRAGVNISWSRGFNPLPIIEFAAPLSVGVEGCHEFALIETNEKINEDLFAAKLNKVLPEGIVVTKSASYIIPRGEKKYSLQSLIWGFRYNNNDNNDIVPKADDKAYKSIRFPDGNLFGLKRLETIPKGIFDF